MSVLLTLILLPSPALAQTDEEGAEAPPILEPGRADVDGSAVPVPVAWTPRGVLVAVAPIVRRLGGSLQADPSGQGWFLTLADTEIAFGPGSDAITRGTDIFPLSREPIVEPSSGVMAPLDFFERTYGDLLGYRFRWDEATRQLLIRRAERREVTVGLDVVHLQGVTTVVFQFPEPVRFHTVETPGGVAVEMVGATLSTEAQGRRSVDDPLVREIELEAERLRLLLRPGALAESYTLQRPFRVVFDVYRGGSPQEEDEARENLQPPQPRSGLHTIVLDPGHGGQESGAVGPSGVAEKDLTLLLARALRQRLQSRLPVRVVLTRNNDVELPLEARTAIANQNKADLFLSIHLNSAAGVHAQAGGAETYFLSLQASDERAAQAAEIENQASVSDDGTDDGTNGASLAAGSDVDDPLYDLQLILWDLAQSHHLSESQRLARLIQEELNSTLGLRDRGVKQAPFQVLMGAAMPAVLVELGFLSNPQEEQRLQDPGYRAQLVDALVRAISRYRALIDGEPASSTAAAETDGGER